MKARRYKWNELLDSTWIGDERFVLASDIAELEAQCERMCALLEQDVRDEEEAIAEWNRLYPKLPWKPEHKAIQKLEAKRAALSNRASSGLAGNRQGKRIP